MWVRLTFRGFCCPWVWDSDFLPLSLERGKVGRFAKLPLGHKIFFILFLIRSVSFYSSIFSAFNFFSFFFIKQCFWSKLNCHLMRQYGVVVENMDSGAQYLALMICIILGKFLTSLFLSFLIYDRENDSTCLIELLR